MKKQQAKIARYQIIGHTNSDVSVSIYRATSEREALLLFIEKYPRFRGRASIYLVKFKLGVTGIYLQEKTTWLNWFDSTKSIKGWV